LKKILVVLALVCSLVVGVQSKADAAFSMLDSINEQRASRGLAALTVNAQLEGLATAWSQTMADQGKISHSDLVTGVTENWKKLGENVGTGASLDAVAAAFVASPPHLADIIDPDFQSVGIGVVKEGASYYVTQKFIQFFDTPIAAKPIPTKPPITYSTTTLPAILIVVPETTTTIPLPTTSTIAKEPLQSAAPTAKVVSPVQKKGFFKMFKQLMSSLWNLIRLKKQ
jgi:hypothetical protein